MAYTKTNWVNDQTELNAENMNHIEDGIYNSQNVELIAVSDEAPSQCTTGDKYYNTEDNLIYTATGTNTWSEDGEEPISGIFYIEGKGSPSNFAWKQFGEYHEKTYYFYFIRIFCFQCFCRN